jgi:hypothetical protein
MADAPVQGINIDPNLIVNAFSNGMAANFNYGAGAQADRASVVAGRDASTNYNYGQGAQQLRQATVSNLQADTATRLIANDSALYDLSQRKIEQEKVGNYARENRSLAQQKDLQENQELAAYNQTPAGQMNIAKLVQSKARTDANAAELGAKDMDAKLRNQDLEQQMDYAKLEIQNLGVNRARSTAFNRQKVSQQLNEALQADLQIQSQTGMATSERRIALLDSLSKSDYQAFADNADVLAPVLSDLDQQYGLPPSLRSALGQVKDAATYHSNGTAIQNTVSSIAQSRAQGQASPAGSRILSSLALIGIDTQDSSDVLNMSIDEAGGVYTFVNQVTGKRSGAFSPDDIESSPELQSLVVASSKRQRTKQNPLTATDIRQQKFAEIENSPLNGTVGERFDKLIRNITPEISDVSQFTSQATKTFTKFQQDLASANPFFSSEGQELFSGLGLGSSGLFGSEDASAFNQKILEDPNLAQDVVDAYANRARGGLSPAVFNSYVDTLTTQVTATDPRYQVSATNSAAAVADRTKSLRAKIQRSLVVPTNEEVLAKAYQQVINSYPNLSIPDTSSRTRNVSPPGLLASIGRSIKGAVVGLSPEDYVTQTIVPQK